MNSTIFWVLVIIVTIASEAATLNLTSIWFSAGAIAALIVLSLGGELVPQLVAFTITAAILLFLVRPLTRQWLRPKGARTNADRIIGEAATVTEQIDNAAALGAVKIGGLVWTARSADDSIISVGESVRIENISGVKVIVSRLNHGKEV